jgi:malonyl CoA-acyl carrier protein transacylase
MFPGQPLEWDARTPADAHFEAICRLCREHCGYDPATNSSLKGFAHSKHAALQIFGVAMSLYRARVLMENGEPPDLIAEHSLGIYAALAACGSIDEAAALELVARIGQAMSKMGERREYALGCAIGISKEAVEQAAAEAGVYVANYNTSRHYLLSGEKQLIAKAMERCQTGGAFSVSIFDCEAPLHAPLMSEIEDQLTAIVAEYRFVEPKLPLVEHLGQTRLTAAAMPRFLVDELCRPVYWERSWHALQTSGVNKWLEVGIGQALTKFNRWIASEVSS